jgi:hypothetical protein
VLIQRSVSFVPLRGTFISGVVGRRSCLRVRIGILSAPCTTLQNCLQVTVIHDAREDAGRDWKRAGIAVRKNHKVSSQLFLQYITKEFSIHIRVEYQLDWRRRIGSPGLILEDNAVVTVTHRHWPTRADGFLVGFPVQQFGYVDNRDCLKRRNCGRVVQSYQMHKTTSARWSSMTSAVKKKL